MNISASDKKFLKALGLKLREIRLKKGWTLEETEEHGWTSWRHLQKIESGKNITVLTLKRLCEMYDIEPNTLFKEN